MQTTQQTAHKCNCPENAPCRLSGKCTCLGKNFSAIVNASIVKINMLESLIQNYGFKSQVESRLPTIDFVYPDYTLDGLSEEYRFDQQLRNELRARSYSVREAFNGKKLAYTLEDSILLEVGEIAPRLRLEEQINGGLNSIYSYAPLLFVGENANEFVAYVVKPTMNCDMAWFELTKEETQKLKDKFQAKAVVMPYREQPSNKGFFDYIKKIFGGRN